MKLLRSSFDSSFDSFASFESFPLELEAHSQSYLALAASGVARAVTHGECSSERPAVHVSIRISPPRVIEQVECFYPEFRSLPASPDRKSPEEGQVDIPVPRSAELVAARVPERRPRRLTERRRIEVEPRIPLVANHLVRAVQVGRLHVAAWHVEIGATCRDRERRAGDRAVDAVD